MRTLRVSGYRDSRGLPVFLILLYASFLRALRAHALRSTQYGTPVQTGEDRLPLSKYGRHDSPRSASPASEERLAQLRALSAELDKAYNYGNQSQGDEAASLHVMQDGECDGLIWGHKELVSSLKGAKNILRNMATPLCLQSSFETFEGPRTTTWRLCASTSPEGYQFFSWVRRVNDTEGTCTWLKAVKNLGRNTITNCLRRVDSQEEVAVSGIVGSHSSCTACAVGEWHETPCDSWCKDGLKGRYRSITSRANAEPCNLRGEPNCDVCPPLWDLQTCNTDVECDHIYGVLTRVTVWSEATGLQVETQYCPTEGESGQQTSTWKKCQDRCASSFASSNGDVTDLSTYYQADCVRFSFRNDTSTCFLHPLHACPPDASTPNPLWISGDILSPSSDKTSLVWGDWLMWSSCDKVDSNVGWKKRIRRVSRVVTSGVTECDNTLDQRILKQDIGCTSTVRKWGYAGDNSFDSSAWIDVAPCDDARPLKDADVNLARAPHLMCWVYTDFEDWSSTKCVPECGTDRVRTRSRRIRQQPVPQENGEFLAECAATELPSEAVEQKQACPGDVDCSSKCVFSDWAPWSQCRCTDANGGIGTRLRARLLVSGDKSECGPLEEKEKCEGVSCSAESSNNTFYAFAGGVGALTLLVATATWYKLSQGRPQEEEHM